LLERAEAAAEAAADDPAEDAPAVDGCATRGTRLIRRMSVPDGHAVGRVSNVFLCSCRMYVYQEKKGRPPDSTRVARVPSPTSDPRPRRDRRGAGGGLGRDGPADDAVSGHGRRRATFDTRSRSYLSESCNTVLSSLILTYLLTYLLTEDPRGQTGTDVAQARCSDSDPGDPQQSCTCPPGRA
jgi:hypothetical protein